MTRKTRVQRSTQRFRRLSLAKLERRDVPSFAAARLFALAGEDVMGAIAVEYLNGDSNLDFIVASEFNNSVNVLLGTGNGEFAPAVNYTTAGDATGAAIGDMDDDGDKDLVISNGSSAAVMNNDGNGVFSAAFNWSVGTSTRDVVIGDFDNDGDQDIVAAGSTTINVLLNAGSGIFFAAVSYSAGANSRSMATADFDGDSDLDIVVSNYNASGTISVVMGNGDGSFGTPKRYRTGGKSPRKVTVGDFNGDGDPDIAVTNRGNDKVGVLLNNGDGNFGNPKSYGAGPELYGITSADFNGNGCDDIAVTRGDATGAVQILLSNADGTFQNPTTFPTTVDPRNIAVGDFEADGALDLAFDNQAIPIQNAVAVLRGRGDGTFISAPTSYVIDNPTGLGHGDFNEDGITDLAAADFPNVLRVMLGNGNGTFGAPINTTIASQDFRLFAVADFDADGDSDVAMPDAFGDAVQILLSQGDGTFQAPVNYAGGGAPFLASAADLDNDGDQDLVVVTYSETVGVLLGNGDGTFTAPAILTVPEAPGPVAVVDFNDDGNVDLAVGHTNFPPGNLSILIGNGDGTFQSPVSYDPGGVVYAIATGDFGGDGKLDIAVSRANSNFFNLHVLTGNGDGTFGPALLYPTPEFANTLAAADFNGDGFSDLAVSYGYGFMSIYLGQAGGVLQTPFAHDSVAYAVIQMSVADFDTNGFPDIAVANGGFPELVPSNIAILMNDATWPPLPIDDGQGIDLGWHSESTIPARLGSAVSRFDVDALINAAPVNGETPRLAEKSRPRPAMRHSNTGQPDPLDDPLAGEPEALAPGVLSATRGLTLPTRLRE